MNRTPCPGCGLDSDGREAVCGVCWSAIPAPNRAAIRRAQKAMGYNPASVKAQEALQVAIATGIGAIR